MKTVIALAVLTAVLTPTAYAIGQARDPRVPGLQRQVARLQTQVAGLQADAAQFTTNYVNQNIDQRVLDFCQGLLTAGKTFTTVQLETEPAFASFLSALTGEGSTTFACPGPSTKR